MTYFGFLSRFLIIPLAILSLITLWDQRQRKTIPGFRNGRSVLMAIGLHVVIAVIYTTPWDNYLVATGVWNYDPQLISGIVLGWVPLEEYTFFVLETILVGLWWWSLARRLPPTGEFKPDQKIRLIATAVLGAVWSANVFVLLTGWTPGTYLALILVWALPAIALQLAFGADLLWHHRKLFLMAVSAVFLYLSAADSLAISSGTWEIDPAQSLAIFIGSLPVEEAVFFLVTVIIIVGGLTLALAQASQARWIVLLNRLQGSKFRHFLDELRPSQIKEDAHLREEFP